MEKTIYVGMVEDPMGNVMIVKSMLNNLNNRFSNVIASRSYNSMAKVRDYWSKLNREDFKCRELYTIHGDSDESISKQLISLLQKECFYDKIINHPLPDIDGSTVIYKYFPNGIVKTVKFQEVAKDSHKYVLNSLRRYGVYVGKSVFMSTKMVLEQDIIDQYPIKIGIYDLNGFLISKFVWTEDVESYLNCSQPEISLSINRKAIIKRKYRVVRSQNIPNQISPPKLDNVMGSISVAQKDENGNTIIAFASQSEAAKCLKLSQSHISQYVSGKVGRCKGFMLEKIDKSRSRKSCKRPAPVSQFSIDMRWIADYKSIKEASEKTGISNISSVCSGRIKQSMGYVFRYM